MDLARAPRRAPLTARKKGSGYENASFPSPGNEVASYPGHFASHSAKMEAKRPGYEVGPHT